MTPFDEPIAGSYSPYNVFTPMTIRNAQPAKAQILVVDDEEGLRDLYKETLEGCGYACRTAPSGQAALEVLPEHPVDLLLLDILMPKMNGMTCFEHIRESYPDLAVIFVTAMDNVAVGLHTIRAGAYDYLVKPVTSRRLEQAVERVLAKRDSLLAERRQRELLDEEQTQRLDQREREIAALNQLFQRHLNRHFAVVEAHRNILDGLSTMLGRQRDFPVVGGANSGLEAKDASREDLFEAVRAIQRGEFLIQPDIAARVLDRLAQLSRQAVASEGLSDRELEVLLLMATGAANKEIAVSLSIGENTVKTHVANIFHKLSVNDRTEAVTLAVQKGIIKL